MRFWTRYDTFEHNPLTMVEAAISIVTIVGALYLLSPFLILPVEVTEGPALAQAISSGIPLIMLGVSAFGAAAWDLWAIHKRKWNQRANALFVLFIIRLYSLLAVILITGFFPMSWLSSFTLLIIVGICYVYDKFMAVKQK